MKKWYAEEYEFTVEVTGFLRSDRTERYCRNGEEIGSTAIIYTAEVASADFVDYLEEALTGLLPTA